MNELATKGRNFTIRIFASILLISIYTIVSYNIVIKPIESGKLVQQIIRFCLTLLLMYFIFKGSNIALYFLRLLLIIGTLAGIFSFFQPLPLMAKVPMIIMFLIYLIALYHFTLSKSFKEYFNYLNNKS